MVACARGTSDRVARGESHARTVAKGSRRSASAVGVDGLFSFSKPRALATEGLDTCTGLPLAVVSAVPVPVVGKIAATAAVVAVSAAATALMRAAVVVAVVAAAVVNPPGATGAITAALRAEP